MGKSPTLLGFLQGEGHSPARKGGRPCGVHAVGTRMGSLTAGTDKTFVTPQRQFYGVGQLGMQRRLLWGCSALRPNCCITDQ